MIYGIAHELMAGGDAPDDASQEYGTDYYESLVSDEEYACEMWEESQANLDEREMWDAIVKYESDSIYNPDKGKPDYSYELPYEDDLDSF